MKKGVCTVVGTLLGLAGPALAVDGALEINGTCGAKEG